MTPVIACGNYDYFEMVCVRQSVVTLTLRDGRCISGIAKDLVSKPAQEFLLVAAKTGPVLVDLIQIVTLSVSGAINPAHNFRVQFSTDSEQ